MLYSPLGVRPRWVRVDDPLDPHALVCRTRRFTLFADSPRAAARVIAEIPRNMRMVFSSTPTRFCRLVRSNWRGPDARRRAWYNHCYLYVLEPGRLVIDRSHRVSRLRSEDAGIIAGSGPTAGASPTSGSRIENGPGYCVRRGGEPVAWGLTHDDGSMGFLHVLEAYRGSGMARALTSALAGAPGPDGRPAVPLHRHRQQRLHPPDRRHGLHACRPVFLVRDPVGCRGRSGPSGRSRLPSAPSVRWPTGPLRRPWTP